jgi:hypothetical protein
MDSSSRMLGILVCYLREARELIQSDLGDRARLPCIGISFNSLFIEKKPFMVGVYD